MTANEYMKKIKDNLDSVDSNLKKISVTPQPKTGHWIEKDGFDGDVYYDCSECGESWTTIEGTPWDNAWNYCPSCGARMVNPQETETWNGYHGQITAPKGTFERIFNDADDDNDI